MSRFSTIKKAAAHLIKQGEEIIIMGFKLSEKPIKPKKILVDKKNNFVKIILVILNSHKK